MWAYPHQLPPSDGLGLVQVVIEDVGVRTLAVTDGDAWSLSTGLSGEPDTWFRLAADTAWRLLTGADVPAGSVTAERNPGIVAALMNVRAIIV